MFSLVSCRWVSLMNARPHTVARSVKSNWQFRLEQLLQFISVHLWLTFVCVEQDFQAMIIRRSSCWNGCNSIQIFLCRKNTKACFFDGENVSLRMEIILKNRAKLFFFCKLSCYFAKLIFLYSLALLYKRKRRLFEIILACFTVGITWSK